MRLFSRSVHPSLLVSTLLLSACLSEDAPTGPSSCSANCVAVLQGDITASRTLKSDTVYTIRGYVKVQNGATLTVEPGTRVVGDTQPQFAGSALFILRGARLMAEGTATNPIVFTSGRPVGSRKPGDWGGIVIVGNGIVNRTNVNTEGPAEVSVPYSGGTNDSDNSGSLRYVRIEFAGYAVVADAELNSLSLYAVGRGTTLEYIQSLAGLDDSFEWWGGAVDGRYLVSYEAGDDHFDWTEGYKGRNQFLIAFQSTFIQPRTGAGFVSVDPQGFEGDGCNGGGCTSGFASTPYSMPVFANFTLIGTGPGVLAGGQTGGGSAMVIRRGTGGLFVNGVVARWPTRGLSMRDAFTDTLFQRDSLSVRNVLFAENGAHYDPTGSNFGQQAKFTAAGHVESPAATSAVSLFTMLASSAAVDWTPSATSAARSGGSGAFTGNRASRTAGFFGGAMVGTTYVGAADPTGAKWWQGWTSYAQN